MLLSTLLQSAGLAPLADGEAEREITSLTSDSKTVLPGSLFICLKGLRADGHAHVSEAVEKGAAAVLTDAQYAGEMPGDAVHLKAADTRRALAFLWDAWYGHPGREMQLIAVTGTNGKTTVATMLKHILDTALLPAGLIGTVQCRSRDRVLDLPNRDRTAHMTTPDPENLYHLLDLMQRDGVRYVVMEASSHALAWQKLAPLHFSRAIFTNLSPEHLDFHGTMEAYFAAKASLFSAADEAILNADDAYAPRLLPYCKSVQTVSAGGRPADFRATEANLRGTAGVSYTLETDRTRIRVDCPQPGRYTLDNTLEAAACALSLGVRPRDLRDALTGFPGVPGRLERVRLGNGADYSVFIDYAHTPDALEKLLRSARDFQKEGKRIVLLFGCGGDRDRAKRPAMGCIASRFADMVYVTSDNSRSENPDAIIADVVGGIDREKPYRVIPDRREAIACAIRDALPGDLILLAGKGHEKYEITGLKVLPFDESAIVAEAAAKRYGREKDGQSVRMTEEKEQ